MGWLTGVFLICFALEAGAWRISTHSSARNGNVPVKRSYDDDCPVYLDVMPPPGCEDVYEEDERGCQTRRTVCEDDNSEGPSWDDYYERNKRSRGSRKNNKRNRRRNRKNRNKITVAPKPTTTQAPKPTEKDCPLFMYLDVMPKPGCEFVYGKDESGCETRRTVCKEDNNDDCPVYLDVMPKPGCEYVYKNDENGCQIRRIVCKDDNNDCQFHHQYPRST